MKYIYWLLYTFGLIVFIPLSWVVDAIVWFVDGYGTYAVARNRERKKRHAAR